MFTRPIRLFIGCAILAAAPFALGQSPAGSDTKQPATSPSLPPGATQESGNKAAVPTKPSGAKSGAMGDTPRANQPTTQPGLPPGAKQEAGNKGAVPQGSTPAASGPVSGEVIKGPTTK